MSQAFDRDNNPLGDMEFGDTMAEAFDKVMKKHPDAHSIMTSKLDDIKTEPEYKPSLSVRRAVSESIIRDQIDRALDK